MSRRLPTLQRSLIGLRDPSEALRITEDDARGGIGESLEQENVGVATPLISAGILAQHTVLTLQEMVETYKRHPDDKHSGPVIVDFLGYAATLIPDFANDVTKAVVKTGGQANLASAIAEVAGKPVLGVSSEGIRYLVVEKGITQQFGERASIVLPQTRVVSGYGDLVSLAADHQESATRYAELESCASRGKASCDDGGDKYEVDDCVGCPTYQTNVKSGSPLEASCDTCPANALMEALPSGSPNSGCDAKHAEQGLVVGAIGNIRGLELLEEKARTTKAGLTREARPLYEANLSTIERNTSEIRVFAAEYLKRLSPVLAASNPW